jgi:hypothetical protein
MSDVLTTLSLVTLSQEYRGDVIRQINRKTVALRLFRFVPGAGKNIAWVPEGDGQLAENYAEGADAANFGSDAQQPAILNWGLYRSNFHLSELAMDAAATSSSPDGNKAIWARNLVNATAKLATTLNAAVFTGAGTGTLLTGLDAAIGSDTNTYAGINRSTGGNEFWKPYHVDPGAPTTVTLAQIRTDIAAIYVKCGMQPDVALVSPATFNKIVALFDATRRYVQEIAGPNGMIRLDAGYQAVEVDGCVFVKDKDCADGVIYYLNLDHVRFEYLPSKVERALMAANVQIDANDGFGMFPMGFRYHMLAKNGPSEKAEVLSQFNLVVDRPNTCGVRLNVN